MFDGTLGNYTSTEYKIELLEGAQLYRAKPFPIPKVHEEGVKPEVYRLVHLQFLIRIDTFNSFLILENLIKELRGHRFLFLKYKIYF